MRSTVQREIDKSPLNISAVRGMLGRHLEQRKKDIIALNQWNLNAEGRNQGLVHLLDYAYARPSKLSVVSEQDVKSQTGLSDSQYHMLSLLDKPDRTGITRAKLTGDPYKFTPPQIEKLVTKGFLEEVETPAYRAAKQEKERLAGELKNLEDNKKRELISSGAKGPAIGAGLSTYKTTDPAYINKAKEVERANEALAHATTYLVKPDVSKRGRLQLIETAGKARINRDFAIGPGQEIEKGTQVVRHIMTNTDPTAKAVKPPGGDMTMWQSTERGKWKEQTVPSASLSHTGTADFKGDGLIVKTWGVLPDATTNMLPEHAKKLGISTVMGGS